MGGGGQLQEEDPVEQACPGAGGQVRLGGRCSEQPEREAHGDAGPRCWA